MRLITRLLAGFGLLVALVTLAPPRWWIGWLAGPWPEAKGRALIVLGGDGVNEQMLGQSSYWRSVYAVWAWREGGFERIVLSGDKTITQPMQLLLVSQGVPAPAIVTEGTSQNTHENAEKTAPLLRDIPGPYVLLSSDYHMRRATGAFHKAGIEVTPRPVPDAGKRINSWTSRWGVFLELVQETAKLAVYKLRGWA